MKNKPCTKCGETFPETKEFFCLDNRNKSGLAGRCRNCDRKAYRAPKTRNNHLKNNYGIVEDDYNKLFKQQKGYCAICSRHQSTLKRSLCIDHDHSTKTVRGLLCNSCNLVLGWVKDDIKTLEQAIKYLKEK